jgi:hypothetical protein
MEQPWITVGVVADIDPTGVWATLAAAAALPGLSSRLGGGAVGLTTCRSPAALSAGPSMWRDLAELAGDAPDAVVACGPRAVSAVERVVPSVAVVDASDLDRSSGLAALVPGMLDPVAVDVRRRMLVHLGIVPVGDFVLDDELLSSAVERLPLRAIDLHVLVSSASTITCRDLALHELRGDASTIAGAALLDDWADAVLGAVPERRDARLASLTAEVRRLRHLLDDEHHRHAVELAALLADRATATPTGTTEP